jgi:subtilisin family serine protease
MTFARLSLAAGLLALAVSAGAQQAPTKTYIVQLSDAPVATYDGKIAGLAATRPAAGTKINMASGHVRAYLNYLSRKSARELARVGSASVVHHYGVAFPGFAAQMTQAQAEALKTSANVVSVTESEIRKLDTTHTPQFLGLTAPGGLWSQVDANSIPVKGENVIIGMIDSGVWPEDPSFGDKIDGSNKPVAYFQAGTQNYGPAPVKFKGICQVGEGFTAAMCNNKVIGARFYIAGFNSGGGTLTSFEYRSPRSGGGDGGHGTHTASTAGGNSNVDASIDGIGVGVMSGIAPRARLSIYKVCWEATTVAQTGCYTADTLKAIDDAVADGVDVINFSVSGTQTSFVDPVEIGYLNATAAGVFVANSAGNSGPANTVAHMSPWIMTVAASTHDRFTVANVVLGPPSGATFSGPSYQATGLSSKPLILAQDAGVVPFASLNATDQTALMRCYNADDRASLGGSASAVLDPAKAAGNIVVCIRGGNVLVNKGAAVKTAGGAGMIIQNTPATANTTILQPYLIPTVHLDASASAPVIAYAQTAGATASFTGSVQQPNVIAPVMADFSSRGPSLANANILKPDITAPGVDIIAGWVDNSLTQAQHDALVLNAFTPAANANSIQGTSMSSPHVAGAAALIKQLHPTWTPAMIKSALMTTTNTVKLASGAVDPNRFGYGAGHLNPNPAGDPGLVYDIAPADYGRFLCGLALTPPAGIGTCAALGSIQPWNLNLASLTATNVIGSVTLNRTVKNVTAASSTYVPTGSLAGWTVAVSPPSLTIGPGASANYSVTLTRTTAAINTWTFGSLAWSDGVHTVTSPLSALAAGFVAPAEVSDVRASGRGTKVYQIVSTYTGTMGVSATGLVPATRTSNTVQASATQCTNIPIPAGVQIARFQLFNADTQGGSSTDIDLDVFNGPGGTGTKVGSSGSGTSDEVVTLKAPAAGTYSACVTGFAVPAGGAAYTLSNWLVGPAVGAQTLKAIGPNTVYASGSASIVLSWNVPAGVRYLGNVIYTDPASASLGSTIVFVDNH